MPNSLPRAMRVRRVTLWHGRQMKRVITILFVKDGSKSIDGSEKRGLRTSTRLLLGGIRKETIVFPSRLRASKAISLFESFVFNVSMKLISVSESHSWQSLVAIHNGLLCIPSPPPSSLCHPFSTASPLDGKDSTVFTGFRAEYRLVAATKPGWNAIGVFLDE